jgi:hypothetical protein
LHLVSSTEAEVPNLRNTGLGMRVWSRLRVITEMTLMCRLRMSVMGLRMSITISRRRGICMSNRRVRCGMLVRPLVRMWERMSLSAVSIECLFDLLHSILVYLVYCSFCSLFCYSAIALIKSAHWHPMIHEDESLYIYILLTKTFFQRKTHLISILLLCARYPQGPLENMCENMWNFGVSQDQNQKFVLKSCRNS